MSTLVFIGVFDYGGEGGIRTPDTLLGCNCLAGSPVRPLQHLSAAAPSFSLQESAGSYYRSRAAARGPAAISSALTSKSTRIVRRRDLAAPIMPRRKFPRRGFCLTRWAAICYKL